MPSLKPISKEGVPAALLKAHRYRVLSDSIAAESICLDVLAVDPTNADAVVMHVLAITDQFAVGHVEDLRRAIEAVTALEDPYKSAYYQGIIAERWAKAILARDMPRAAEMAYEWIEKALTAYGKAEALRPAGNDEAILRWNTCVRMLNRNAHLRPRDAEAYEPSFE
ncbi:MAG: hypothetical protein IPK85_24480 [Gemmatimonadetes bacterium]|nr:hypothetical protein [Gemmatimonadota bacterium]